MNWLAMIFEALASKQNWANSDKAHGLFQILVPLAESEIVQHITVQPGAAADGGHIITINQHPSMASAVLAAMGGAAQ